MDQQAPGSPEGGNRRQFLLAAGLLSAGPVLTGEAAHASGGEASSEGIPLRPLGLGGHHLGDVKEVEDAIRLVREAIDGGVTFFDNCWEYWNGKSENWLGRVLKGRRDKVFLMTKVCTHGRSGALGRRMLDESLRRLGTDHLDLWQVNGVCFDNDPELAYAKGGIIEELDRAKRAGKARFVGFTGHKEHGYPPKDKLPL